MASADEDGDQMIVGETLWMVNDPQKSGIINAGLRWLARSFMRVNFVFTLVAMMVRIIWGCKHS